MSVIDRPQRDTTGDRAGGRTRRRSPVSPDRLTVSGTRVWALTALVGVEFWAALSSLPLQAEGGRTYAAEAGALCAVLAVFGLRSVPIRWVVRATALGSGLLLARFGELGALDGVAGSWRVLVWLAVVGASLVLSPSSRAVPGAERGMVVRAEHVPPPEHSPGDEPLGGHGEGDRPRRARVPGALILAATVLVAAAGLLAGPRAANQFPTGARVGDVIDLGDIGDNSPLLSTDTLDMTTRPRLSDEVVMTVRSSIASFWRTETFDVWDGANWTRSDEGQGQLLTDGEVEPAADDVAAREGVESTQQFQVEVGVATAVPTAPSAVRIDASQELAQRPDGTLVTARRPLSEGATYTVRSRQVPTDPDRLRAAGDDVPAGLLERYAAPPVATDRVVALAESITAGADNDYDRVRAIERWMDANTEYSLDAPLAPRGVDVVDDFLFESQEGWCEQIASSLVVLARLSGVPARLATGFTPGEWDAVGSRFVVRERDAHAWVEVWFPGTGWVTFDPTADVPLAGTDEATPGAAAIDWRQIAGVVLLTVGVAALVGGPLRRWWVRARRSRRARRALAGRARTEWDVAEEQRIERLGRSAGRPRRPDETVTRYADSLVDLVDDPDIAERGAAVDRHRYAGAPGSGAAAAPD